MKRMLIFAVGLLLVVGACVQDVDDPEGINSFYVRIGQGETGSANDRVPFPEEPIHYRIDIAALDFEGNIDRSYYGKVAISVEPAGRLGEGTPSRVQIEKKTVSIWNLKILLLHHPDSMVLI